MDSERLIELVREYKFLYDLSDKRYGDSQKKDAAWKEIGKRLGCSGKECKKTWNALRDSFRRAIKRQKDLKSGQEGIIFKKWKFEDELAFLKPYLKERSSLLTSYLPQEDRTEDNTDDNMETAPDNSNEAILPVSTTLTTSIQTSSMDITPKISHTEKNKTLKLSKRDVRRATSTILMKYLLNTKPANEIDLFFSAMASTVKQFPPHQRAMAKAQVFEAISKLELSKFQKLAAANMQITTVQRGSGTHHQEHTHFY